MSNSTWLHCRNGWLVGTDVDYPAASCVGKSGSSLKTTDGDQVTVEERKVRANVDKE